MITQTETQPQTDFKNLIDFLTENGIRYEKSGDMEVQDKVKIKGGITFLSEKEIILNQNEFRIIIEKGDIVRIVLCRENEIKHIYLFTNVSVYHSYPFLIFSFRNK